MKAAVCMLAIALTGTASAQETQTEPTPILPTPRVQPQDQPPVEPQSQPQPTQTPQQAAPIERRSAQPDVISPDPVTGPISRQGTASQTIRPANNGQPGTIRVETRLVNVAVNVVDAHGSPVGGFERQDFRIFEDGKAQEIALFDREASSPLSIVLAIDASETVLTSERLEREAAKHFVRAILRPQDELELMDFADTVREIVPFTNQPKRIETGLGEIQRGDETALYDAIFLASDKLAQTRQEAGRRRVLVLISDGGDTAKRSRYAQALEEAERAGAMIYCIIIVPVAADAGRNTGGEHALIQMAEDTGGKYYYVVDPTDLEPAFRHVSDDLRTQYLLGYYAPQTGGSENGFRRIQVKLADTDVAGKFSLRYRTGYFADAK